MRSVRLAWLEFQRFRGPRLQWVPALLVLAPVLLGVLGLAPLWDPQQKFERVPAALVNLDKPVQKTEGSSTPLTIEAGNQLAESLKASHSFLWQSMGYRRAMNNLNTGQIYFALVIPAGLSATIADHLAGRETHPARIVLHLNDAHGYLIGNAAAEQMDTVQDEAESIQLGYLTRQTTDIWSEIRKNVDTLLNDSSALPTSQVHPPSQDASQKTPVRQIADDLAAAAKTMSGVTDVVEAASSGSGKMSSQLNDAASAAQTAQGNAAGGNSALTQQSTSQTATAVRLAQDSMSGLSAQLQTAASNTRVILTKITELGLTTTEVDKEMAQLTGQLQKLARSIPPAQVQNTAYSSHVIDTAAENLHPADTLGRALAPLALPLMAALATLTAGCFLRPINPRAAASGLSAFALGRAGAMPYAAISLLATCGLYAVMQALMSMEVIHGWLALGLCMLTGTGFAALGYMLKVVAGLLGEILFALLMAVQLGACGGLYPVETTNALFATLHSYLPMTYTVEAFRAAISGGEPAAMVRGMAALTGTLLVAFFLTVVCLAHRRMVTSERLNPLFRERCG